MRFQQQKLTRKNVNHMILAGLNPNYEFELPNIDIEKTIELANNFETVDDLSKDLISIDSVLIQKEIVKTVDQIMLCLKTSVIDANCRAQDDENHFVVKGPSQVNELDGADNNKTYYRARVASASWSLVIKGLASQIELVLIPTALVLGMSQTESWFNPIAIFKLNVEKDNFKWLYENKPIDFNQIKKISEYTFRELELRTSAEQMLEATKTPVGEFIQNSSSACVNAREENYAKVSVDNRNSEFVKFDFYKFEKEAVTGLFNELVKVQAIGLKLLSQRGAQLVRLNYIDSGETVLEEAEFAKKRLEKLATLRAMWKRFDFGEQEIELTSEVFQISPEDKLSQLKRIIAELNKHFLLRAAHSFESCNISLTREQFHKAGIFQKFLAQINDLNYITETDADADILLSLKSENKEAKNKLANNSRPKLQIVS